MKECYLFILILSSVVSAYGQTQSIQVNPGWNLFSLPLKATDSLKSVLFPSAVSSAFIYQNGYQVKDTIQNGPGFWLKFDSAETINITGTTIYDDTIEVYTGWNIIGSLSTPVPIDSVKCDPPDLIISNYFNYTGGTYHSTDTLQLGFGTWVKVKQNGYIILSGDTIPVSGVPCPGIPTVEYAGKTYNTVQIGSQCWLKENLDVGTMIDSLQNQTDNDTIEKYCYRNDPANCTTYGGLYQWDEAIQYSTTPGVKGICPNNWHIPTLAEFQTLSATVGGDGNALKAIGPGTGTNTSGFSALLSGYRLSDGVFIGFGTNTGFWSSTEGNASSARNMGLYYFGSGIDFYDDYRDYGFSVRCVKDEVPQVPEQSSPPNGADSISAPPTLIWKTTQDATSYTLQVSSDSLFSSFVYNQSGLTDTSQQISGLNNYTKYYWRMSATNSYGTSGWSSPAWNFTTSVIINPPCPGTPTVFYSGKTYNTVQIGGQCWLKENLDVGTRIDGSQNQTDDSTIEKYCYNDDPNNCATYGGLYQWNEAMQYSTTEGAQGICPAGFHIPTLAEAETLRTTVDGDGNALKAIGQGIGPGAGTNTSGFTALLSGYRYPDGYFYDLGYNSIFWSSSEITVSSAYNVGLNYNDGGIYLGDPGKQFGFSVRCIKD